MFAIAYFGQKVGNFTIQITDSKRVLSLSEKSDFEKKSSRLHAQDINDAFQYDVEKLPSDIDNIDGSHNGQNYLAYTFYLMNTSESVALYNVKVTIQEATQRIDEMLRFRIYTDGEYLTYAKARSDDNGGYDYNETRECVGERSISNPNVCVGAGGEYAEKFASESKIVDYNVENFIGHQITKYTVVLWIEGSDPQTTGYPPKLASIKLNMSFTVIDLVDGK